MFTKLKKYLCIMCGAILVLGSMKVDVRAEDGVGTPEVIYTFADYLELGAKWYADGGIGPIEIAVADMEKGAHVSYMINATLTEDAKAYLQTIEAAYNINIHQGGEPIVFGRVDAPVSINQLHIDSTSTALGIDVTVYATGIEFVSVDQGRLTVNGDVNYLDLGDLSYEDGSNSISDSQEVQINGNLGELNWYCGSENSINHFKGNCSVSGVIAEGVIHEGRDLDGFGKIYPITKEFHDINGVDIIANGVVNSLVVLDEISFPEIYLVYTCNCYGDSVENDWVLYAMEDKETWENYLGYKRVDGFGPADILEGTDVRIYSSYSEELIDIPVSLSKLYVADGRVKVTGDVENCYIEGDFNDYTTNTTGYTEISGNVSKMEVVGSCKDTTVIVDGNITNGYRKLGENTTYFTSNGSDTCIMQNGKFMLMTYASPDRGGIGYRVPDTITVEAAVGITEENYVRDADDNIIATKTASLEIAEVSSADVPAAEKELFTNVRDVPVISWLDVDLSTYYVDTYGDIYEEDGYETESVYELTTEIPITVEIPENNRNDAHEFAVLRNHNGVITELPDTDDNPATVTFLTNLFSTYALIDVDAETGGSQGNNNNTTPTPIYNPTPVVVRQPISKPDVVAEEEVKEPAYYTVVRGDSLSKIARKHGMTLRQLLAMNPQIKNINRIYAGQKIMVSLGKVLKTTGSEEFYVVTKGDSLNKICRKYHLTLAQIMNMNPTIKNPSIIFKGQQIVRRRIEIGLNSELNSRLLPTRLRSIVCDCEHMPE